MVLGRNFQKRRESVSVRINSMSNTFGNLVDMSTYYSSTMPGKARLSNDEGYCKNVEFEDEAPARDRM